MWRALACSLLLSLGLGTSWAQDLQPIPALTQRVTDTISLMPLADVAALEQKLAEFEKTSNHQLALLIVKTVKPEDIAQYSYRVVEKWKLGRKGADNGALLIIAKDDRRIRIEVGRGLEGVMTDVESRRIIGDVIAPFFKQGQFSQGIHAGLDSIMLSLKKEKVTVPADEWKHANQPSTQQEMTDTLMEYAPQALTALAIFGAFLSPFIVGLLTAIGAFLIFQSAIAGGVGFVAGAVLAFIVRSIFGRHKSQQFGRAGRDHGMWFPTGGGGSWGGGGGGSSWSGGGGGFGGGGASGGWDGGSDGGSDGGGGE